MRKLILLTHAAHPIETEATRLAQMDFAQYGYGLVDLSVAAPDAETALRYILGERGHELFFLQQTSWALGSATATSLHTLTGIPTVIMICDRRAYFSSQSRSLLDGTVIFTPGEGLPRFSRGTIRLPRG